MKPILFVVAFVLVSGQTIAQQFKKIWDITLPDSIQSAETEWVDADNDGLLDILLLSKINSGRSFLQFVKGDTLTTPVLHSKSTRTITINALALIDYNRDNRIDVVASGNRSGSPVTVVYLNKGGFDFEEKVITPRTFLRMKFADLDNDIRPEWIVSGENGGSYFTHILKQQSEYNWQVANDTLQILASAIEVLDANGDGNTDMFVSGQVKPNGLLSEFLINEDEYYFKPYLTSSRNGASSGGDFNKDGLFDLLLMSKEGNGTARTDLYRSNTAGYAVESDAIVLNDARPFVSDLNSNGIVDVNYLGRNASSVLTNIIEYANQDYDTLVTTGLITQKFGDVEHDGDLDLIQLIQGVAVHVVAYENQPVTKNTGPKIPKNAIAVPVFDRVLMYWDKPADDHTDVSSLTYDVHVNGSPEYQAGDFDLLNERRLLVTHGNNGTENYKLIKNVLPGNFDFAIQAVDNSFHAGGLCIGNGGAPCANVQQEALSVCSKEPVILSSPSNSLWFSFSKGFLGLKSGLNFAAADHDTVFYYDPAAKGCSGLKAWTIKINNDTLKTERTDKYACENSDIRFQVESGWTNVQWKSQLRGDLGTGNTIQYKVSQPDSVTVTLSNTAGCVIVRKTAVKISKPQVLVNPDNYKILRGSEVQLSASGAERYEWTPAAGLSQTNIANPMATPPTSIVYMVTGYDSLNCSGQASVAITVEGAGFIPNLFTPNDDGKNDQLRVYGMSSAKEFMLTIYNREGTLVFKTTDISDAVQRGWDGTKNGTKQPAGVYFWKVKGEMISGGQILLNGKDSGSIVLVR